MAGRPEGRKAGRPEGRKAGRPEGRKAGRPEGRKAGAEICTVSISTFNQTTTENLGFTGRRKSTREDVIQSFSEEVDEKSQVDVDDDACNDEDV
jgi:hypothetical protein